MSIQGGTCAANLHFLHIILFQLKTLLTYIKISDSRQFLFLCCPLKTLCACKVTNFRKSDFASRFVGIGGCSVLCTDINNAPHAKQNRWVSCFSSFHLIWLNDSLGWAWGSLALHGVIVRWYCAIGRNVQLLQEPFLGSDASASDDWCARLSQGLPGQCTLYVHTTYCMPHCKISQIPFEVGTKLLDIT